jgi:hypothetical protein
MPKGMQRQQGDDGYHLFVDRPGAHRAARLSRMSHRGIDAPAPERAESLRTISQQFR